MYGVFIIIEVLTLFPLSIKKKGQQHIELCSKKLVRDSLPVPSLMDNLVTTSTVAPFSDKLMLFHKIDLFSMKIRSYASGASLNGRHDIGVMYLRFLMEIGLFAEEGGNILINRGWMEQIPGAVDRGRLGSE